MEAENTLTAEELIAKFNAAHEPLRQIVLDSYLLREKAVKAEGEDEIDVAAWLRAEAARMREEEGVARLNIAFCFFDAFVNPLLIGFVGDSALVAQALDRRAGNA